MGGNTSVNVPVETKETEAIMLLLELKELKLLARGGNEEFDTNKLCKLTIDTDKNLFVFILTLLSPTKNSLARAGFELAPSGF